MEKDTGNLCHYSRYLGILVMVQPSKEHTISVSGVLGDEAWQECLRFRLFKTHCRIMAWPVSPES